MKIICICSGGLDSTVLYYYLQAKGHKVLGLHFNYGSKQNDMERKVFLKNIPNRMKLNINLTFLKKTSMLNKDIKIPKGHYESESMKSTVVPFRNGIMLSYAIALAEEMNFDAIAIGSHAGDHAIYPDCSAPFNFAMNLAAKEGTYNKINLVTPFVELRKEKIVEIGVKLKIEKIMARTYSCYVGGEIHCGKCGTCVERKEAFRLAGIKDLTKYVEV